MGEWRTSQKGSRLLLSVCTAALFAFSTNAAAEMSEIDAFQLAVNSQSSQDALAFLDAFGSSHLVPDLIELLRPDVAAEVCASLPSGAAAANAPCAKLTAAIAAFASRW